ncbi:MAG: ATP-dependent DNA helicase, partial [Solirubrobacteraceae bacterium]
TTADGIRTEVALLAAARRLEAGGQALANPRAIERAIATREAAGGRPMTDEQRQAAVGILGAASRLHILSGHAGTAKTTSVLATVAGQAQLAGLEVRAMAPTASAAKTLGEALGARGKTVAAVLHAQDRPAPRALWIVDEAGMVSAKDMRGLLARAEHDGATVILAGDRRQIGSVGAGAAYGQLEASVRPEHRHELTHIVRQSNDMLRAAVYDAAHGRVEAALQKVELQQHRLRPAQLQAAASRYQQAIHSGKSALVVALSRADRADVNKEIHALRLASGQVRDAREVTVLDSRQWTAAQRADATRFQPGDVLVWGAAMRGGPAKGEQTRVLESRDGKVTVAREDGTRYAFDPRVGKRFDVFEARPLEVGRGAQLVTRGAVQTADGARIGTGTRLEVTGVHVDRLTVRNEMGKTFELATRRGLTLDHGYAMTADQAQGKTVDVAIGVLRSGQENLADRSRFYVAISRGREGAVIVTDDRQKLAERLQINTGQRQTALEHGDARSSTQAPASIRAPVASAREYGAAFAR